MDQIREFWDQQAKKLGDAAQATSPDTFYRDYEIGRILEQLPKNITGVLDVGCGNGYSTAAFARARPKVIFLGMDYSDLMIKKASSSYNLPNLSFITGDVRKPIIGYLPDCIISERCLINLASWEEQQEAIRNLWHLLPTGGRLILVENTIDGLKQLNKLREKFDLPKIGMRWHNQYFDQAKLEKFLSRFFMFAHKENIGNLYYILSRVVYAKMAQEEGKEPQYDHIINAIAARLEPVPGPWSPNMLWSLVKTH